MTVKALLVLLIAATLVAFAGWLVVRGVRRSEDPARILFKLVLTLVIVAALGYFTWRNRESNSPVDKIGVLLVCVAAAVGLGAYWTPQIGAALARPLTSLFDDGDTPPEPQPFYSIAQAKRKAGHYREALHEIQQQLDRFPGDVTGHMLMAEILAEDLNDLAGASATLERLLQQPDLPAPRVAAALNTLADWQLKHGRDIEAARQALERIAQRLPGTPESLAASQRLAHLGTTDRLLEARDPARIPLKPGVQNIGLMKDSASLRPAEEDPAVTAGELVRHLAEHPDDSEARERLALLYAGHYQRLDLAVDQLNQLIEHPLQPARNIVRWLHLLADLHVKFGRDEASARAALERVIEKFPGQAAAETARSRLEHLRLEIQGRRQSEAIQLGVYEQNLGLKQGPPRKS
ncbi:MAG TPA: tetratricopeptide repeat protein [Methylomirabilota bacterium]|nr:tetratricopeptide repeat protein [Methylomirabilota bacterium]